MSKNKTIIIVLIIVGVTIFFLMNKFKGVGKESAEQRTINSIKSFFPIYSNRDLSKLNLEELTSLSGLLEREKYYSKNMTENERVKLEVLKQKIK